MKSFYRSFSARARRGLRRDRRGTNWQKDRSASRGPRAATAQLFRTSRRV